MKNHKTFIFAFLILLVVLIYFISIHQNSKNKTSVTPTIKNLPTPKDMYLEYKKIPLSFDKLDEDVFIKVITVYKFLVEISASNFENLFPYKKYLSKDLNETHNLRQIIILSFVENLFVKRILFTLNRSEFEYRKELYRLFLLDSINGKLECTPIQHEIIIYLQHIIDKLQNEFTNNKDLNSNLALDICSRHLKHGHSYFEVVFVFWFHQISSQYYNPFKFKYK